MRHKAIQFNKLSLALLLSGASSLGFRAISPLSRFRHYAEANAGGVWGEAVSRSGKTERRALEGGEIAKEGWILRAE